MKREEPNPIQEEIDVWRYKLPEKTFDKIFRGFKSLCKNHDDENAKEYQFFMTEASMQRNFNRQFGYKNDFLASRIYNIITNGVKDKRVFFPSYLKSMNALINGSEQMKQRFIFKIYDIDGDTLLGGTDLQ